MWIVVNMVVSPSIKRFNGAEFSAKKLGHRILPLLLAVAQIESRRDGIHRVDYNLISRGQLDYATSTSASRISSVPNLFWQVPLRG